MKIVYEICACLVLLVGADIILRQLKISNEYKRKIAHVSLALALVAAPYFLSREVILGILGIFFILLALYWQLGLNVHAVKRSTLGEFYFLIGVAAAAYFFLPDHVSAFQFGLLVLGVSDTAANLIGSRYGRHQIKFLRDKSWEGTVAFFLTTVLIAFIFVLIQGRGTIAGIILIALLLSAVESGLSWGLDNLFLPSLGAYLLILVLK